MFEAASQPAKILLHDAAWYAKRNVDVFLGDEAVEVDPVAHTLLFSSGHIAHYDKLVLAFGSRSVRPALSGNELAGVFVMRKMNDALRMSSHLKLAQDTALVLGGGLLGLEAAKHLVDSGVKRVEVVEFFDRLLPRQLDAVGAALLQKRIAEYGIAVRLSSSASSLLGSSSVKGVAIVDERLRTSDPDIYAVGDLAEFGGVVWGNLVAALEQAPVAAAQILGEEGTLYRQTIPRSTLKVAGLDLTSLGSVQDDSQGVAYARVSADGCRYEKYVVAED
jgi:NAD(P)H-nitrite reductase large subunit